MADKRFRSGRKSQDPAQSGLNPSSPGATGGSTRSHVAEADDPFRSCRDAAGQGFRAQTKVETCAEWLVFPLCVAFLIWPALWNHYPIVFADTGTYLSQAMHRYLGWDRPVFYSLFIYSLHLGRTTWPVILLQSALTVLIFDLVRRAFGLARWWLPGLIVFLSLASWLPWTVSELMPDLFTPLLVLLLGLLVFSPCGFRRWQRAAMTCLAAFMITTQQSSVLLASVLLVIILPLRLVMRRNVAKSSRYTPVRAGDDGVSVDNGRIPRLNDIKHRAGSLAALLAPCLAPCLAPGIAVAAMVLVNTIGFGRVSLSPYGNVFLLARVIYDGPGMTVLRRDCPVRGWRLCPYLDQFPPTSDDFLWRETSPIVLAGGHKSVSADADAIIRAAVDEEPLRLLQSTWNNTIEQLTRFASGDGLDNWGAITSSWIDQDFPKSEQAAFHAARQQASALMVPPPLNVLHRVTALAGIAAALLLMPAAWRRRHVATGFLAISLLALPLSAAITGGLSGPHDRYQSRIVWLPAAVAFLTVPALSRRNVVSRAR
jgi:hypothetical protein